MTFTECLRSFAERRRKVIRVQLSPHRVSASEIGMLLQ